MKTSETFLLEIGCEELPAKAQPLLSKQLAELMTQQLHENELAFAEVLHYATPRRLAIVITNLATVAKDKAVIRKGPYLSAAFDQQQQPTQACLGFARSCGVDVADLSQEQDGKEKRLVFRETRRGETSESLLPTITDSIIKKLTINKPMRWGNSSVSFIRPVLWTVMLHGDNVIDHELLGKKTSRITYGHRFHHPQAIHLQHADDYAAQLKKAKVIVSFTERSQIITEQARNISQQLVQIDQELLNEVTGLVEWPVALQATFDSHFLEVPPEAIITAMQSHQKYFPILMENQLQAKFVIISNIESKKPEQVIQGNQRVLRARLSDAQFFFHADLKTKLATQVEKLKQVIFQTKLGSVYDKMSRTRLLAEHIAKQLAANTEITHRAATLAKADLMTAMVGEFPELQGIMGYYYALADGESQAVANSIKEHYLPRFAGDSLPTTNESAAVAIADKLDTIVGLFAINQPPTGERDPFALRRQAVGILRICIAKQLPLDLAELITVSLNNLAIDAHAASTEQDILDFILERLRAIYQEQQVDTNIFNAVLAVRPTSPYDFDCRIQATQQFMQLPEAQSLAQANKRVNNILKKQGDEFANRQLQVNLLTEDAERKLAAKLEMANKEIQSLYAANNYTESLKKLAELKTPVDQFFDEVMVMVDDQTIRENRLALLAQLRCLFSQVADISLLAL